MSELDELRAEVSRLRDELAELRKGVTVHHYHHQVLGQTLAPPPYPVPAQPYPLTMMTGIGVCSGEIGQFGAHMTAARTT